VYDTDRGSILILTLLLTIVLAAIVLALATYATTGLATSKVTTERTASNALATDGMTWMIEDFAKKNVDPTTCAGSPFTPPSGLIAGGAVTITCTTQPDIDGHPTVLLVADATTSAGTRRRIDVVLQVPTAQRTTQVHSWIAG
jgi:hypothetical protein